MQVLTAARCCWKNTLMRDPVSPGRFLAAAAATVRRWQTGRRLAQVCGKQRKVEDEGTGKVQAWRKQSQPIMPKIARRHLIGAYAYRWQESQRSSHPDRQLWPFAERVPDRFGRAGTSVNQQNC